MGGFDKAGVGIEVDEAQRDAAVLAQAEDLALMPESEVHLDELDPEVIVLSGGVIHQGPDWRSETWKTSVAEGYASQALDPLLETPILIGELEGDAPLIGAAEHLLASL